MAIKGRRVDPLGGWQIERGGEAGNDALKEFFNVFLI
jgi:hypothetical protein